MIIACDVDDVLLRMYAAFAAFHNRRYGGDLTEDSFFSYLTWEVLGVPRDEAVRRMETFYGTDGFKNMALVEGAQEGIRRMFACHALVAVTGRPSECVSITQGQLRLHFPGFFRSVHHTGAFVAGYVARPKSDVCTELGATVILEDAPMHAIDCADAGMRVILFDRPWNRGLATRSGGAGSIERVYSWDEALGLLL